MTTAHHMLVTNNMQAAVTYFELNATAVVAAAPIPTLAEWAVISWR